MGVCDIGLCFEVPTLKVTEAGVSGEVPGDCIGTQELISCIIRKFTLNNLKQNKERDEKIIRKK